MRTWTLTRPLLFRFDPLLPSEVPSLLVVSLVAKRHRTLYDVRNPLARSIKSILQVPKTTISISSVLAKRRNYLPLFLIQFNPRRQTLPVSLVRELRAVRHRLLTRRRQIDLSSYEALLRKKLSPPILHPLPRQVAVLASNLLQLLCSVLRVELSRFPRLSHRFLLSPVPSLNLHQRLSWLLRLNLSRWPRPQLQSLAYLVASRTNTQRCLLPLLLLLSPVQRLQLSPIPLYPSCLSTSLKKHPSPAARATWETSRLCQLRVFDQRKRRNDWRIYRTC